MEQPAAEQREAQPAERPEPQPDLPAGVAPEYPPPSYTGSAGETSAWVRGADTPPELPMGGGSAAHYLATVATGGALGLYRWEMGPRRSGSARTVTRRAVHAADRHVEEVAGSGFAPPRPSCSRTVPLST